MPPFSPTLQQHLATDYRRNLAVTAGAGTGKTAVLTRRIVKILGREKLSLDRLLVVTFTDKAAVEMKERIYRAIDDELGRKETRRDHFQKLKDTFLQNYNCTFHSFCASLLREYPIEAQVDPFFQVLDDTEKVFTLRKCINRSLKELAADRNQRDIHLISAEFSRGVLANAVYRVIQLREETGTWLDHFPGRNLDEYLERLEEYRQCMLREMSYKLYRNPQLSDCLKKLEELKDAAPEDDSALTRRWLSLRHLLSLLLQELEVAVSSNVDDEQLIYLQNEIIKKTRLSGVRPGEWPDEAFEVMREVFTSLRYLMRAFDLEEFNLVPSQEEHGFELLQALARISRYCLEAYHRLKENENYLDFQDLQLKVLHLFNSPRGKHLLEDLRQRFRFIMVDEFQDTNDLQWQIIKKIATDRTGTLVEPRLFVVGDEKQAIYSFRGGDVRLFSRVRRELQEANLSAGLHQHPFDLSPETNGRKKDYRQEFQGLGKERENMQCGEIIFADNFRSAKEPIRFFNQFFHDLLSRPVYEEYDARPQPMKASGNPSQGSVELMLVDSGKDSAENSASAAVNSYSPHFKEALLIVDKIKEAMLGDEEKYRRVQENARQGKPAVAILLNRRNMLKTYEEALRMNRIDFTVVRGRGFFQRQEIVDLGNLLSFLIDPADDLSLAAFLRSPAGHLSDRGLFLLTQLGGGDGETLYQKLLSVAREDPQPGSEEKYSSFNSRERLALQQAACNLERWLSLVGRTTPVELLRLILEEGGYYAGLGRGPRGKQAVSNVEKLLDSARSLSLEDGYDLADFTTWLNNRIDYIEEEGEAEVDISLGGAVQIMTVHQAKGLEFPMVLVPDLAANFNLGQREDLLVDHVPFSMEIGEENISRGEQVEMGINSPNLENQWESEPTLIKRIIRRRLRERLIAEKKRLFYVAATRAMDHLVLVGHFNFQSTSLLQRVRFSPLDQLNNWMDWLNQILGLYHLLEGHRGVITYGNPGGEPLKIPYRIFSGESTLASGDESYRTTFPL